MKRFCSVFLFLAACACVNAQVNLTIEQYEALKSYCDSFKILNTRIENDYILKAEADKKDKRIEVLGRCVDSLNIEADKLKKANHQLSKSEVAANSKIESLSKKVQELKSSTLKKKVQALNTSVDSLKKAIAVNDSVTAVLMDSLASVNGYLERLEAFRLEFTKSELLARKTVLDKLFSKVELTELQALHEELKPFAVDSILPGEKRLVRNDEAKAFIDLYENVEYAIANKMRFLCCDSLLEAPFNAQAVSSLFAEIRIEKAYMSPGQSAEFDAKINLLNRYASMAIELCRMVDDVNNDREVKRNRYESQASNEMRSGNVKEVYESRRIKAGGFEGLVYLFELYSRHMKAFNENPLKLEGVNEIEKIEQEIKSIAEEAVKLQKK